jgi:four helix bundle protein
MCAVAQASHEKHTHFRAIAPGAVLASSMHMTPDELKHRTKTFAVEVFKFSSKLPNHVEAQHVRGQLLRSGTAVASNYRASCRAKSRADFVSKMTNAEEEADETLFWLEMLVETETVPRNAVATLMDEAEQLLRIVVASITTARRRGRRTADR